MSCIVPLVSVVECVCVCVHVGEWEEATTVMSCIVSVCCYQTCHYREACCKITNSCDSVEDPHNEVTQQISPLFSLLPAYFLSLNTLSIFIFLRFSLVDIFHLSIFFFLTSCHLLREFLVFYNHISK